MTSWLAHYGVIAVLLLMLVDAVFPAASELVMVYAGALASGALTHRVDVLGWHATGFGAYLAVVLAGVIGYQLGAVAGWWIGIRGGRAFLERRGRWFHLDAARLARRRQDDRGAERAHELRQGELFARAHGGRGARPRSAARQRAGTAARPHAGADDHPRPDEAARCGRHDR